MKLNPLVLSSALLISSHAIAQQAANPADRELLMGMKSYYAPAQVVSKDGGFAFTLYRTAAATKGDEVGNYTLHCESRNVTAVVNGQSSPAYRVLPGEELYVLGKKLCEWDQKGFFQKLMD